MKYLRYILIALFCGAIGLIYGIFSPIGAVFGYFVGLGTYLFCLMWYVLIKLIILLLKSKI